MLLTKNQNSLVATPIFITGVPRSGTTLIGKIIASFKGVDYHYEPPTFYMLCSLLATGALPEDVASKLLKVYLYEDLMVESAHGRRANLRPNDDTFVLNSISWQALVSRWTNIRNRGDAANFIKNEKLRIACKMPNILDALDLLVRIFPASQVVIIVRDGREVVRSMLQKGWLNDAVLQEELWPYALVNEGINVPYSVEPDIASKWAGMNSATRACYLWRRHAQLGMDFINRFPLENPQVHQVRYEKFLQDPEDVVRKLTMFLGNEMTECTKVRIREVCPPKQLDGSRVNDFYGEVDSDELRAFRAVNESLGYVDQ